MKSIGKTSAGEPGGRGRRVSYMSYGSGGAGDGVRVADVASATTRVLVDLSDQWDWVGAWSPDGARFLFLSYGKENGLFELDVAGGRTRFLGAAEGLPAWSADGRVMVWTVAGRPGMR